jgi:hypothetical protein
MSQKSENRSAEIPAQKVAEWIAGGADEFPRGPGATKAFMDLPPVRDVAADILVKAIIHVLKRYRIDVASEVSSGIEAAGKGEFSFPVREKEKDLKSRTVLIDLSPEVRSLVILGQPPVDGIDGSIELLSDLETKPGQLNDDGSIDFKYINRFKQVVADEVIARIYHPVNGYPGTNVYGVAISPKQGVPCSVEIGEGVSVEQGFDEARQCDFDTLSAVTQGILRTGFEGGRSEPSRLKKLSIQNKLVVKNVDFSTGSLGNSHQEIRCAADVVVEGSIRGAFSAMIDGDLDVKDAIEGERVDVSGSLKAAFVRSFVKAKVNIDVGTAVNAQLHAGDSIRVSRELSQSRLSAAHVFVEPSGVSRVLCGKAHLSARTVHMTGVSLRNFLDIELGPELFAKLKELEELEMRFNDSQEAGSEEIRQRVKVIGEKLRSAEEIVDAEHRRGVKLLRNLVAAILMRKLSPSEAKKEIENWLREYNLQLHGVGKWLLQLVGLLERQAEREARIKDILVQREATLNLMDGLEASISGEIWDGGRLAIRCGNDGSKWHAEPGVEKEKIAVRVCYMSGQGLIKK